MIRKNLPDDSSEKSGFRWRGHEVSRIEDFSDSVFAITIALLLVSVEVPNTFEQLVFHMTGFIGFSFAFAFLIYLWHAHYLFFRRYGLRSNFIITINGVFLFLTMFYSYPLKFLVNLIFRFSDKARVTLDSGDQIISLMILYSMGMACIFIVLIIMYIHAYRKRSMLELNTTEIIATKAKILEYSIMVFFGLLSTILVLTLPDSMYASSGLIYFFIGPTMFIAMHIFYKRNSLT